MSIVRTARLTAVLTAAGTLAAFGAVAAQAATPTAGTAGRAPVTTFVTNKPWTPSGKLQVKATTRKASPDSTCVPSSVTGRKDAYRCFIGNYVMDPAYKSPKAKSVAFKTGSSWHVYTGVRTFEGTNSGPSYPVEVKLTNGATCYASTGAGPAPLPKFPYWAGWCTGGPYGSAGATWRATEDDGKNANYPLLALDAKRTKWSVAVEHPQGKVRFEPAKTVYK